MQCGHNDRCECSHNDYWKNDIEENSSFERDSNSRPLSYGAIKATRKRSRGASVWPLMFSGRNNRLSSVMVAFAFIIMSKLKNIRGRTGALVTMCNSNSKEMIL